MKTKKKPQKHAYPVTFIHRENYEISSAVTKTKDIPGLPLKYVLKCINGMYKNRALFISTSNQGEIIGSGDVNQYGLTLQIQGASLSPKHVKLLYDGCKGYEVMDFGSENGTWMDILGEGVQINHGDTFRLGPHQIRFKYGSAVDEIQELCQVNRVQALTQKFAQSGVTTIKHFLQLNSTKFVGYGFDQETIEKLQKIAEQTQQWYNPSKKYRQLTLGYMNAPLYPFSLELSWEPYPISSDPGISYKNIIGYVRNYKLVPRALAFYKLIPKIFYPFNLHSRLKLGDLQFTLERFNIGSNVSQAHPNQMEDNLLIQQVGGLDQLMSLFCVIDGYGGAQAMSYLKQNLKDKIKGWSSQLNTSQNVNKDLKGLMATTLLELDYQFYKEYPNSKSCGATVLILIIIGSRVFVYNLGDCIGYLFRNNTIFQINTQHKPTLGDERIRLEKAGAFVQNDKLLGKCPISRCIGQFQYKNIQDYQTSQIQELKSYLSCLPDSTVFDINCDTDQFLLLGTEGFFKNLTINQITDEIVLRMRKIQQEQSTDKIVDGLIRLAKNKAPCGDMAVILIILKKGAYYNHDSK